MSTQRAPGYTPGDQLGYRIQLLVAFLSVTAISGTRPTTTYRALDLGADNFEVGLVQSAFSFLPALTAVAVGRWIDRRGEGRTYFLGLVVLALGGVVSALAGNLPLLGAGQALVGLGAITALISGQAMIASRTRREHWNRRYGTYAACLSLGQLVGPSLAAAIQETPALGAESERVVFLVGALLSLAGGLATLMIPKATTPVVNAGQPTDGGSISAVRRVVRQPGMLAAMYVSIVVASTIDVLAAYLPVYGTVSNLPVQLVGLLLSIRAGATMASRVGMDYLLRRLGWRRVMIACLAASAAMLALIPTTVSPPLLIAIMAILGLTIGLLQPMTVTWVANMAARGERGTALAVRLTGNRASLLVVPAVMGAVAGGTGVAAVFWILAAVLGFGVVVGRTARLEGTGEPGTSTSVAADPIGGEPAAGAEPGGGGIPAAGKEPAGAPPAAATDDRKAPG